MQSSNAEEVKDILSARGDMHLCFPFHGPRERFRVSVGYNNGSSSEKSSWLETRRSHLVVKGQGACWGMRTCLLAAMVHML